MAGFGGSQPVDLSRASEMEVLAALAAVVCISRRRRPVRPERMREGSGDPDGRAMRDAQTAWASEQERIASDSIVDVVQRLRAAIVHTGAAEARGARRASAGGECPSRGRSRARRRERSPTVRRVDESKSPVRGRRRGRSSSRATRRSPEFGN
jgi:hypothetical protein